MPSALNMSKTTLYTYICVVAMFVIVYFHVSCSVPYISVSIDIGVSTHPGLLPITIAQKAK
jgi:hypothetical protein